MPQDAVQGPRPVLPDARAARWQGVLPPRDRSRRERARGRRPPTLMDTILTLPLVLAVVLVELALGGTFVSWFLERRGEAPGGFLKLVAAVDALAAAAAGALALGGIDAGMLLGHWYLVTPKLPTAPLRNASLIVVAAVVGQLVVVLATVMRGDLSGTTQTGLVVAIGIRIGVGLLMTLAVALAAWWTARMNTQSSTGLLYVGLGSALAGEISARVL